jgi:Coproporphyrinogen III oxidase and related Fe-S oxidoreductases
MWNRLCEILEEGLSFQPGAEVSVEGNPDSLRSEHLSLWKMWRVTRISLGVQSFSEEMLQWLGRLHTADRAMEALLECRKAGFSVSGDLIFGIPGQDLQSWHQDLKTICRFVDHLSIYQLTAEQGTPIAEEVIPTQTQGYPLYRFAQWYLGTKGFSQYEVASFARKGKWCRHNLAYWRQGNVLALGPSAWGYYDGLRYRNPLDLEGYLASVALKSPVWTERLSSEQRAREAAILALRTRWGIRWSSFRRRFGLEVTRSLGKILDGFPADLFIRRQGCLSFSQRGFRLANRVWEELV